MRTLDTQKIVDYVSSKERFIFCDREVYFTGRAEGEVAKKAFLRTCRVYYFLSENLKTRDEVVNFRLEYRKKNFLVKFPRSIKLISFCRFAHIEDQDIFI